MVSKARVRAAGSFGSIRIPVRPSSMTSGKPPTRVATIGNPAIAASRTAYGIPSERLVSAKQSMTNRYFQASAW